MKTTLPKVVLRELKLPIRGRQPVVFPPLELGDVDLEFSVRTRGDRTEVRVTRGETSGPDVKLRVEPHSGVETRPGRPWTAARLRLRFELRFSQKWRSAHPAFDAVLVASGLVSGDPVLRVACHGPVDAPRCRLR